MNVNNEVNPYQILNEKEKLRKGFVYKELELQGNGEKGRRWIQIKELRGKTKEINKTLQEDRSNPPIRKLGKKFHNSNQISNFTKPIKTKKDYQI